MKTYSQKMMDYLECDGWDIDHIEKNDLEWWSDEIWKLKSNWSPSSAIAHLTFLVDPMHEGDRKKGQNVWGIGCTKAYPTSRKAAESCYTVGFGKSFKKEMDKFLVKLDSLRTS